MLRKILILVLAGLITACSDGSNSGGGQQSITGTPEDAATVVVQAISNLMTDSSTGLTPFTDLFDSCEGVRFMPYYRWNDNQDLTFHTSPIPAGGLDFESDYSASSPPNRVWGIQDGSGNPINMNIHDYFANYVWDYDYINGANVTVTEINSDSDFLSQGNLINNLLTKFLTPQYRIVEYHQPGIDPSYGGMDWTSLMVILKDVSGGGANQWTLVGLAHGSWTI